jgi:hypothetical protein
MKFKRGPEGGDKFFVGTKTGRSAPLAEDADAVMKLARTGLNVHTITAVMTFRGPEGRHRGGVFAAVHYSSVYNRYARFYLCSRLLLYVCTA